MQRKRRLAPASAVAAALAAVFFANPAMAQEDQQPAASDDTSNNQYSDYVWQWRFRDASPSSFFRMTRRALLGQDVVDRNGNVVGQIVNDARFVNGDLAGVEVTQPGDRVAWITVVNLRFNRRVGQMFTGLTPEQTAERARVAGNNPFPLGRA